LLQFPPIVHDTVVDDNYEGDTVPDLLPVYDTLPGYKCPLTIQPSGNGTLDEKKERDWLLEEKENRRRRRSSDSPDYAPTRLLHIEKNTRLFTSFFLQEVTVPKVSAMYL
jgi:hypothetical protein